MQGKLSDERIEMQTEVSETVRGVMALAIERYGSENAPHIIGAALGIAAKSLQEIAPGAAEKIVAGIVAQTGGGD